MLISCYCFLHFCWQHDPNLLLLVERYHLDPGLTVSEIKRQLKYEQERVQNEIRKENRIKEGVEKMKRAATERRTTKTHMSAEIKKSVNLLDDLNQELSDLRTYLWMSEDGSTTGTTQGKGRIYVKYI